MKLCIGIVALLVVLVLWQNSKIVSLTYKTIQQKDTMDHYQVKRMDDYSKHELFDSFYIKTKEPELYHLNDTLIESQRIITFFGYNVYIIRVDQTKDSSLYLTYKHYLYYNSKDKTNRAGLIHYYTRRFDNLIWQNFKVKMNDLNVYDVQEFHPMMDCIGDIEWEANINGAFYTRSLGCNEAFKFRDVCNYLIEKVQNGN